MRHQLPFSTTLFLLLLSSLSAQNTFHTPVAGSTISPEKATVHFSTTHAVDSVVLSIEYLSDKGTDRKRLIGSFTTPSCNTTIPLSDLPDQYGAGATIVAEVYRQDDTLDITKVRNLYVQQVPQKKHVPMMLNTAMPLVSTDQSIKGTLTVRKQGAIVRVVAKLICPDEKRVMELIPQLTYFLSLDPEVSTLSHPSNSTTMIQVPTKGAINLFTHIVEPAPNFALKQRVTKLPMVTKITGKGNILYARFDVPAYLLGSSVPKSWMLNFAIKKQGNPFLYLASAEIPQLISPRLMYEVKNK